MTDLTVVVRIVVPPGRDQDRMLERANIDEASRAILLASLQFVDAIVFFSDETPLNLIENLIPDILAKGGDYKIYDIVGHEIVIQNGGEVVTVPLTDGFSTTNIVDKIKKN